MAVLQLFHGATFRGEDGKVLFSGVSFQEMWTALEKLVDLGLTRAIGLSNFNSKQVGPGVN